MVLSNVTRQGSWHVVSTRYGLDYDGTFCPVVRLESLRTLIALSTHKGLELHHVEDVHTAFLNGTLQEKVYMKQPIGYEKEGKEHLVCRLKKSIYGLKQSSRCWNTALDSHLKRLGFSIEIQPLHLRLRRRRHLLHRSLRGRHDSGWEGQKQDEVCLVKVRHQGPRQTALLPGHVHCPEPGGKGDLDGATHIHSETPDQDRDERQQTSGSWTPTREREQVLDQPLYQSVVGSLMYLATCTRQDIAYAVGMLAASPTKVTGLLRNVCCVT